MALALGALRESGALAEADRILELAMASYPEDPELAAHHAQVAANQGNWVQALRRWEEVIRQFPDKSALWQMAAVALRENGRLDDAEQLITWAMAKEPERREDWPEAMRSGTATWFCLKVEPGRTGPVHTVRRPKVR